MKQIFSKKITKIGTILIISMLINVGISTFSKTILKFYSYYLIRKNVLTRFL